MEPQSEEVIVVEAMSTKKDTQWAMPASIVVAGALIAGAIFLTHSTNPPIPKTTTPSLVQADSEKMDISGSPFIGSATAPIVMIYWSDYQCPYCKKTETEVIPGLVKQYVDTGHVKIVFKEIAILGSDSLSATLASHAVWDLYPDKYFAWREAMFAAQDQENGGFGDMPSILALTKTISGIDASKVEAEINAKKDAYQTKIGAAYAEFDSVGLNGTPAVLIGTTFVKGAQPITSFVNAINQEGIRLHLPSLYPISDSGGGD